MPETLERWTAARVRELPDDGTRNEVVDGVLLVTPAPRWDHQEAVLRLAQILDPYLRRVGGAHLVLSPADVELDPHTLVQPDLFVVPSVGGRRPRNWGDITGLLLSVEIVSPASARADRTTKRRRYQRAAIPEYWVVDLDARLVERWRPGTSGRKSSRIGSGGSSLRPPSHWSSISSPTSRTCSTNRPSRHIAR